MQDRQLIRTQWLTQGLVLSVILNMGLLVVCMFYALRQNTIDLTGSFPVAEVVPAVVYEEEVPLHEEPAATPHQLFAALHKERTPELEAAFTESLEFLALATLFADTGAEPSELLTLALAGEWEELVVLSGQLDAGVTAGQRRRLLVAHVGSSSLAADLLVRCEGERAADFLDDEQVLQVIPALTSPTLETTAFLVELLLSPRNSSVWEAAAARLYTFVGEALPMPYDHMSTLARFVPGQVLEVMPAQPTLHEVEPGESLWSIANRYCLSVDQLKETNELGGDAIYPGQTLRILAAN